MNLREGTRRLALLLGVIGAILAGVVSYVQLQSLIRQRADHRQFEQLANSDVVQQERKRLGGWVTIDQQTGERIQWEQRVDKGGIKTIHWTKDNEIESIDTQDGHYLFPTPAPSASPYLLTALFPIVGFFIPWGALRAIGWVGAGFVASSK
jgi:hypothetical protein